MNFCIDIGNTFIKVYGIAHIDSVKLLYRERFWAENFEDLYALLKKYNPKKIILSSVREDNNALIKILEQSDAYYIELTKKTPLPFSMAYKTPETLGSDRVAVTAGAQKLFPFQSSLVINTGTCITYDFIEKGEIYHGGSISPGRFMRYKALKAFTGKLPLVEPAEYDSFIGQNTYDAIRTGVEEGCFGEIKHRISQYKDYFGPINILLTGGDGNFFEKRFKNQIFADSNLLAIGLYALLLFSYENNNEI